MSELPLPDDQLPALGMSDEYGNHIIAFMPEKIKLLITEYPNDPSIKHYLKVVAEKAGQQKAVEHGNS